MSHHHHHDNCGDESHDHDHDSPDELGPKDNLYPYIDRDRVVALNSTYSGSRAIKPWNERFDEERFIESDVDDQLILRVPFTGSVKLRALLLKTGPADQTPTRIELFPNESNLDFDSVSDKEAAQGFDIPQDRDIGQYPVKPVKFSNVTTITVFFPASQGADTTRVYYVGFLGTWSERKTSPVVTVYETQANPADHAKLTDQDLKHIPHGMVPRSHWNNNTDSK
ncbi:hypothetical protein PLICRDRAFT_39727 [Plicaturopsis crispa FD-325 SS-3]|nr:hypothetical protein PLICRDRAFT_39727 [Plicaturopsis crispa FD-325 SS-3]